MSRKNIRLLNLKGAAIMDISYLSAFTAMEKETNINKVMLDKNRKNLENTYLLYE